MIIQILRDILGLCNHQWADDTKYKVWRWNVIIPSDNNMIYEEQVVYCIKCRKIKIYKL